MDTGVSDNAMAGTDKGEKLDDDGFGNHTNSARAVASDTTLAHRSDGMNNASNYSDSANAISGNNTGVAGSKKKSMFSFGSISGHLRSKNKSVDGSITGSSSYDSSDSPLRTNPILESSPPTVPPTAPAKAAQKQRSEQTNELEAMDDAYLKELQSIPVVFVPGVKASFLINKYTGKKAWLSLKDVIHEGNENLMLPLETDALTNRQKKDDHIAAGVFETVKVIKGYRLEFYRPGLRFLEKQGRKVHRFPYDWRRSNNETAELLVDFVKEVCEKHKHQKVQLVCHSMGCIISYTVMKRIPHLIHSAIYCGPPFDIQSPLFLKELLRGSPVLRNKKIMSPRVLTSFLSPYCTLSASGLGITRAVDTRTLHSTLSALDLSNISSPRLASSHRIVPLSKPDPLTHQSLHIVIGDNPVNSRLDPVLSTHYEDVIIDYYDPESWLTYKFGIFNPNHPQTVIGKPEFSEYYEFLKFALADSKKFVDEFRKEVPKDAILPPFAIIAGDGQSTRGKVLLDGPKAYLGFDIETMPYTKGDDLIPIEYTILPNKVPHIRFTTKKAHSYILHDLKTLHLANMRLNPKLASLKDSAQLHQHDATDTTQLDAVQHKTDLIQKRLEKRLSSHISMKDLEAW